jgi:hypothetical protein
MRISDYVLACAGFLTIDEQTAAGVEQRAGGTAFFVQLAGENPAVNHVYLVTAKHCVADAWESGSDLRIRFTEAGDGVLETRTLGVARWHHEPSVTCYPGWMFPEDPAVDVAVLPFASVPGGPGAWTGMPRSIGAEMFATTDVCRQHHIGVGDELAVVGLFIKRPGRASNIPIVRSGIIAAMPTEPLVDDKGRDYDAYLAEVRSIGGLSGSPVFVYLEGDPRHPGPAMSHRSQTTLLGLVRGHWDEKMPAAADFSPDAARDRLKWNTGIAVITPFTEVIALLHRADLVEMRRDFEREAGGVQRPTSDLA